MKSLDMWFEEYSESHRNPVNKLIHWICVPSIFFSIVGLLVSIPSEILEELLPDSVSILANWATPALLLVMIFYFRHSFTMGLAMTVFSMVCIIGAQALSLLPVPLWLLSLIIFAVAWIGQFYGHKVEGKKPSFFQDIQFLLIGPAWLMSFIFRGVGLRY